MWFSISDQIKKEILAAKKKRNISRKKEKETLVSKRNRYLKEKAFWNKFP
jgi:hypothetical protein